ncbi:hypothetical protein P3T76_000121 [Phytophthora citrophthora]|uniref:Uncharacterized protein n=1 Tax=Phytophthora citrophthora TaxID=4793 RepID=A0AAD9H083_9STRA|nr:hypothetical protein P3T76_000121 [Phytophthora citrophthora]
MGLVLHSERAESAWPSPPRPQVRKRRSSSSLFRRTSNPRWLLCSAQQIRSPPTPKTFSRRRSRHFADRQKLWITREGIRLVDLPRIFTHYCSTLVETIISTTATIVHNVYETASTLLQNWWGGDQDIDTTSLEVVEYQSTETHDIDDILEENNRLKRILEFAMTSHVLMNEATNMLENGVDAWMKQAEEVVDAKVQEAEQERDALTRQFEELQEQLDDKDQEIKRLLDDFVWATESLNTKEDEICELHERLEQYEALLKAAKLV